jgi:hypothetical protein
MKSQWRRQSYMLHHHPKKDQMNQDMCFELGDEVSGAQKTAKVAAHTTKTLKNHPSKVWTW